MYLKIAFVRNPIAKLYKNHQTAAAKVLKQLKLVSNGGNFVKIWMNAFRIAR